MKRNSSGKWEGSGRVSWRGQSDTDGGAKFYIPAHIQQDYDGALTDALTWADANGVQTVYIQDQP